MRHICSTNISIVVFILVIFQVWVFSVTAGSERDSIVTIIVLFRRHLETTKCTCAMFCSIVLIAPAWWPQNSTLYCAKSYKNPNRSLLLQYCINQFQRMSTSYRLTKLSRLVKHNFSLFVSSAHQIFNSYATLCLSCSVQASFYVLFLTLLSYALIYGSTVEDPTQYSGKADGLRLFCEVVTVIFLMFYFFEECNEAERWVWSSVW